LEPLVTTLLLATLASRLVYLRYLEGWILSSLLSPFLGLAKCSGTFIKDTITKISAFGSFLEDYPS
jgi:hypothetical protein